VLTVQRILRRINLAVEDGEFMVLVGLLAAAKYTLRLIAGLEELTEAIFAWRSLG